jgi:hypothetical protein
MSKTIPIVKPSAVKKELVELLAGNLRSSTKSAKKPVRLKVKRVK